MKRVTHNRKLILTAATLTPPFVSIYCFDSERTIGTCFYLQLYFLLLVIKKCNCVTVGNYVYNQGKKNSDTKLVIPKRDIAKRWEWADNSWTGILLPLLTSLSLSFLQLFFLSLLCSQPTLLWKQVSRGKFILHATNVLFGDKFFSPGFKLSVFVGLK